VRGALATLPWVEKGTIDADRASRIARFGVTDKRQFNMEAVRRALPARYRSGLELLSGPE
jgi:hypothetical protein